MRRLMTVVLLLSACAAPAPSPRPPTAVPTGQPLPTSEPTPSPTASSVSIVDVGDWSAECRSVPVEDCEGVVALFVNNLARSRTWVFDESGGNLSVAARPGCPVVHDDRPQPRDCWQASAHVPDGSVCMIIARRPDSRPFGFGQIGGDSMVGRAGGPPPWWESCR